MTDHLRVRGQKKWNFLLNLWTLPGDGLCWVIKPARPASALRTRAEVGKFKLSAKSIQQSRYLFNSQLKKNVTQVILEFFSLMAKVYWNCGWKQCRCKRWLVPQWSRNKEHWEATVQQNTFINAVSPHKGRWKRNTHTWTHTQILTWVFRWGVFIHQWNVIIWVFFLAEHRQQWAAGTKMIE